MRPFVKLLVYIIPGQNNDSVIGQGQDHQRQRQDEVQGLTSLLAEN